MSFTKLETLASVRRLSGISLGVGAAAALGLSSWAYGQDCGAGDVSSAEACLVDDDEDTINGGCNSAPDVFEPANVGGSIDGTVSTYVVGGVDTRDTDWYLVTAAELAAADTDGNSIVRLSHSGFSEAPVVLFIVALGDPLCDSAAVIGTTGFAGPDCAGGAPSDAIIDINDHPNGIVYFVATGNPDGGLITSGFACSTGNNDYVITMEITEPPTACAPGSGPCGEPNGTPGCEDPECCAAVCDSDPICCIFPWDETCVGIAEGLGCLPEPILTSADGLWTAELDPFGQILNFFPAAQPKVDNVWESVIYEANSEVNDMLSRRVDGVNYTVVQGPTISEDGTSALTVLEANDVDLTMEIEIVMLDGLSGGAHVKIRCQNTGGAAISCKIFYYCDFDVGGDFGDDEATTIPDPPDPIFAIEQIDNDGKPNPLWLGGCPDYEGWQIATWPELLTALNDGVPALTNTDTTPPPGGQGDFDHTAALSSPMTLLQPGEIVELQAGVGGVDFVGCEAPPPPCPWDLDGGGFVGAGDLLLLLADWGNPYGAADLLALLADWGACP